MRPTTHNSEQEIVRPLLVSHSNGIIKTRASGDGGGDSGGDGDEEW